MIEKIKKHKHFILMLIFIILAFFIFGLNSFHENIWYDEAHQMLLNRFDFFEIINLSKADTSGPIYALYLKIFTSIFGNSIIVARIASFVIFAVIFILAFYPIRRLYNLKSSIIFSTIILLSSISFFASIEIRPYAIAITTTLGATIYSLLYLRDNKISDLIKYFIFALIALYSHSYAMISMILLIIFNSIYSLITKKGRKIIIINLLLLISFYPWIKVIQSQNQRLEQEFWVNKPNLTTIAATIENLFTKESIINFILILIIIISLIISIIKKRELRSLIYLFIPSIGCLIAFYIWSVLKNPLFAPKYVVPISGIIYLMIAKILANNKIVTPTIIFSLLLIPTFLTNFQYEKTLLDDTQTKRMLKIINEIPKEERAFFNTHEFGLGLSEYYFPNSNHYIKPNSGISLTGPKIFGNLITELNFQEKYIIVWAYINESEFTFEEIIAQGYLPILKESFYIKYNNGFDIYILKKL